MSVLSFLFKDKQGPQEQSPPKAKQEPAPVQTKAVPLQPQPGASDDASSGEVLDFDEIRSALDQIADVLGRGEGYDMLKSTTGDVTAVELPIEELMELKPDLFNVSEVSPADEGKKASVLIEDIFNQLGKGKILTTVGNLVADMPGDYLAANISERREEEVSLPLPLIVNAINPSELQKRTTTVERASGINDLPNLFSPPSAGDTVAQPIDVVAEEPVVDEVIRPEPVVEEAVVEPVVEEVIAEPVEAVVEEAVVEEGAQFEAMETVAEEVAVEETVEAPVAEEVVPEPVEAVIEEVAVEEAVEEPVAEEVVPEPVEAVVEEVAVEDIEEEPVAQEFAPKPFEAAFEECLSDEVVPEPVETVVEDLFEPEPVEAVEEQPAAALEPETLEPAGGQLLSHPSLDKSADASWSNQPAAASAQTEEGDAGHVLLLRGLDLNHASYAELVARLDGVGPRLATRIVEDREKNGPFLDVLDLARVAGLGKKTFSKITHMRWPEGEEGLPEMRKEVLTFTSGGYLNVREVATRFGALPGFDGCLVAHSDGYIIASSWNHKSREALGAFAPQIFKKVARYIKQLNMGEMDCMTVIMDQTPITFVPSEDVYFVAIHKTGALSRKHVRLAFGVGCRLGRLLKRRSLAAA